MAGSTASSDRHANGRGREDPSPQPGHPAKKLSRPGCAADGWRSATTSAASWATSGLPVGAVLANKMHRARLATRELEQEQQHAAGGEHQHGLQREHQARDHQQAGDAARQHLPDAGGQPHHPPSPPPCPAPARPAARPPRTRRRGGRGTRRGSSPRSARARRARAAQGPRPQAGRRPPGHRRTDPAGHALATSSCSLLVPAIRGTGRRPGRPVDLLLPAFSKAMHGGHRLIQPFGIGRCQHLPEWLACYFMASRSSRQACSQRRHASAQTRQC